MFYWRNRHNPNIQMYKNLQDWLTLTTHRIRGGRVPKVPAHWRPKDSAKAWSSVQWPQWVSWWVCSESWRICAGNRRWLLSWRWTQELRWRNISGSALPLSPCVLWRGQSALGWVFHTLLWELLRWLIKLFSTKLLHHQSIITT